MKLVVAPQGSEGTETDGIGEEDLGPRIYPYLSKRALLIIKQNAKRLSSFFTYNI